MHTRLPGTSSPWLRSCALRAGNNWTGFESAHFEWNCRCGEAALYLAVTLEIETKLRVEAHEPVRARLRAAGATRLGEVIEWNEIFDRADGSLRQSGVGVRVRSAAPTDGGTPRATLTVKGPRQAGALKRREEREVEVSDGGAAGRILHLLGYVSILRYEKRRESWSLGDCRIELDEPPRIGLFVEIEGPDEPSIRRVQETIGLGHLEHLQASYVRMLSAYCEEHGIADRSLRLPDNSTRSS